MSGSGAEAQLDQLQGLVLLCGGDVRELPGNLITVHDQQVSIISLFFLGSVQDEAGLSVLQSVSWISGQIV